VEDRAAEGVEVVAGVESGVCGVGDGGRWVWDGAGGGGRGVLGGVGGTGSGSDGARVVKGGMVAAGSGW